MRTSNMIDPTKILICMLMLFLVGCQQEKEDLSMYVQEVKAQQKADIPPLPVMKPYEKFNYSAAELRDPFVPTVVDVTTAAPKQALENGVKPDSNRVKEALEAYELTDLQFVGTLEQESLWALIRSPEGVIHRVQIGNYMGNHHGKILSISDTELRLKEIVPDEKRGGFIERETTLAVVEVN